jgi:class 3 adenylate cyclase
VTAEPQATILLVDDAPENLSVLAGVLGTGYRVKAANSGANALRICAADPVPDLILLDVMMPELDGIQVCERLKADPRTHDIPIIFVTAMGDPADEARGLAAGAVDYITKPFSPPVVQQRVRLHLELKRARDQLQRLGRHYSSYLSEELIGSIQRGETASGLTSKRKPLTVFFSDIVDFTRQTDLLTPEEMTLLLNGYFDAMSEVVRKHQGTLDKYIGDACMVFFGDPTTRGVADDAKACVHMALDMQAKIRELQPAWMAGSNGTPLAVRMSIATGPCTVGNFGSAFQQTYTVLGTTVNLAARLEPRANPGSVLIAEETWQLVRDAFECTAQPPIQVKGISRPIKTHVVEHALAAAGTAQPERR